MESATHVRFQDRGDAFVISIPVRKRPLLTAFLVCVFAALCYGGFALVRQAPGWNPLGLVLGLAIWGYMWFQVTGAMLWSVAGVDRIRVTAHHFQVRREILGVGRWIGYDLTEVRNLRVDPVHDDVPHYGGGVIFEHGSDTIGVGGGIERRDAEEIVARLRERIPAQVGSSGDSSPPRDASVRPRSASLRFIESTTALEIRSIAGRGAYPIPFLLIGFAATIHFMSLVGPHAIAPAPVGQLIGAWLALITLWLVSLWLLASALRAVVGVERVRLGADRLAIRDELFGLGRWRFYSLETLEHVRIHTYPLQNDTSSGSARYGQRIVFDYDSNLIGFGEGLSAPDLRLVLERLRERIPDHMYPT